MLPDIELVADQVHRAWIDSKLKQGVTSRKAEDGEELIVPYADLSEKAKELDRATVRAVYAAIKSCAAPAADRWIPVTERLPDDDLTVMIAPLESDVWLGYHDEEGWHFGDAMPAQVSHWKPMPEGPKP